MNAIATAEPTPFELLSSPGASLALPGSAGDLLRRMFADPYLLQPQEREVLVAELRGHVAAQPRRAELRVLLGMALCVALLPEEGLEELREAVTLAPDFFLAHLKLGELCMRLRIIEEAARATETAGRLAEHPAQRELARRQATQIRGMRRHGILRTAFAFSWRQLGEIRSRGCLPCGQSRPAFKRPTGATRRKRASHSTSWMPWRWGRPALAPAGKEGPRSCLPS